MPFSRYADCCILPETTTDISVRHFKSRFTAYEQRPPTRSRSWPVLNKPSSTALLSQWFTKKKVAKTCWSRFYTLSHTPLNHETGQVSVRVPPGKKCGNELCMSRRGYREIHPRGDSSQEALGILRRHAFRLSKWILHVPHTSLTAEVFGHS